MPVATPIPRYNKFQKLVIDNNEITLINHLKDLRTERNITKKKISNLIKQNDSWYAQIERNDDRQKTIYRPDLINIISIIKYGANSINELINYSEKSTVYIDKIIKAIPVAESLKELEYYQLNHQRTAIEQDNLFSSLNASISKRIFDAYNAGTHEDKELILEKLQNFNSSLKIDPIFILILAGLPVSEFLYTSKHDKIQKLVFDLYEKIYDFKMINDKNDKSLDSKEILSELISLLEVATKESDFLRKKKYDLLPIDKISF